jgi:hypothetical protein
MTPPDAGFLADGDNILSLSIRPAITPELNLAFKYSLFPPKILGFSYFLFNLQKIKMIELGVEP